MTDHVAPHAHVIEWLSMRVQFHDMFGAGALARNAPIAVQESAMSVIRFALLAAAGAFFASVPAIACDYRMKSDVTAEAPSAASPATGAQTTEQTAAASAIASNDAAPIQTEAAPAQTAKVETGEPNPRVTN
jgi:hypothetical protein